MSVLELTPEQYHSDAIERGRPSLSSSIAHVICTQSPAHARAKHPRLSPQPVTAESDAFDLGTVCHALLLGGLDAVQVLDFDSYRTKDARAARDQARANGMTPILAAKWLDAQTMIDRVREQLNGITVDPPLFENGEPEVTLTWEEAGVLCRARLDWLHTDVAAVDDLKTSSSPPDMWERKRIYEHGYDLRAAFYLRGVKALTGASAAFRWLVVEKEPPHVVTVVTAGADVLALGDAKVEYALRVWRDCLASGVWPAYRPAVRVAELPAWEEQRWLEKMAREAA